MSCVKIKISTKWLNTKFNCTADYITNTCKGKCCQGSNKILISLLKEEEENFNNVKDGLLCADSRNLCPFKKTNGLCSLHNTPKKPFGCIASPFTLNKNNTLIVRYRYSRMKCCGSGLPAHKTFEQSLKLLFPEDWKIIQKKCKDNKDFYINMDNGVYNNLKYLDNLK